MECSCWAPFLDSFFLIVSLFICLHIENIMLSLKYKQEELTILQKEEKLAKLSNDIYIIKGQSLQAFH